MPFNLPVSIPDSGYRIARSLRFNSADSTYLNRTLGVATNRRKYTVSTWIKRAAIPTGVTPVFFAGTTTTDESGIYFSGTASKIDFYDRAASVLRGYISTAGSFRDPAGWLHLVGTYDTDNATSADRMQLWINGNRQDVTINNQLATGIDPIINSSIEHRIGRSSGGSTYSDFYLAELHFIDGLVQPASAFGQIDPATGVWMPKAYTGHYGANGFKLDFADNGAATAAALGKDRSGMSNLLTYSDDFLNAYWSKFNNVVLTAGANDPLGGTRAVILAVGSSTANPYIQASRTVAAGQQTTYTVYAAAVAISRFTLYNDAVNGGYAAFELATGTIPTSGIVGTGSGVVPTIENVGGGWWKCSVTVTHGTAGSAIVRIIVGDPTTTNGASIIFFRASSVNGGIIPAELQYTNGAAVSDKNWTPNAFSVTAGVGNDSLVDTPTNYGAPGANGGGEVRGNYATLSPITGDGGTPTNGNLTAATAASGALPQVSTFGMSAGQWYWEFTPSGTVNQMIGIVSSGATAAFGASGWAYYAVDGQKYTNSAGAAYGTPYGAGVVIGVAFDATAGTLAFYRDGASQGTAFSGLVPDTYLASIGRGSGGAANGDFNFGQRPFAFAAPAGFKALCTQNLPTPAIKRGDDAMTVNLRTGNGGANIVSGLRFSPDLVWIKSRGVATDHAVSDTARGSGLRLETNTTDAEVNDAGSGITFSPANGFTCGGIAQINTNAVSYVDWVWDKGAIPGVDIVNLTASAAAIPHSLGVKPEMILTRSRAAVAPRTWFLTHKSLGASMQDNYLVLNTTAAKATSAGIWGGEPTSTQFFVANGIQITGEVFVGYLFASIPGFSAFGSYIGNGLVDGPFVWTGFRPRWLLTKLTSVAGASWWVRDTARQPTNGTVSILFPDLADPEYTAAGLEIDILSNGFKLRTTNPHGNSSGNTFIYAAFAEHPFKYARAR